MADDNASRPNFATPTDRFEWLGEQPLRRVVPDSGLLRGARESIGDIFAHRHLWWLFTRRELKARYKDSALGYLWTLVRPLFNLLIYYLAIGKVLGAERSINDFAIYVFAGLTAWSFFATALSGATASVIANSGIVKKVYLPRELFPLTAVGSAIVDFLSQLAILVVGALLIRGLNVHDVVLWGPIAFLMLLVWATAFGLVLSALNVYLRDIQYLVEVVIMIGFWLTPSVYSYSMVVDKVGASMHWIAELYLWNPTALAVMGFQRAFWSAGADATWPPNMLDRMAILIGIGLILIFFAQRWFARLQRNFAQEL